MPYDAKHPPKAMTMERFNELMNAKPVDLGNQRFFLQRVSALDKYYQVDHVSWGGMCWGISAMARDYFLIGRFDLFVKLLSIINAIPLAVKRTFTELNFAEELEAMLQLGLAEKNQSVLTTYNGIQMLIGRASLYQSAYKYPEIIPDFPNYQSRDTWERVTPIAQTIDPEGKELPSKPTATFSAAYTKDELVKCLNLLQTHINVNCSFDIQSVAHSIELNYSPTDGWVLLNPDKLPTQSFTTTEDLAQGLIDACIEDPSVINANSKPITANAIVFNAALYTTLGDSVGMSSR